MKTVCAFVRWTVVPPAAIAFSVLTGGATFCVGSLIVSLLTPEPGRLLLAGWMCVYAFFGGIGFVWGAVRAAPTHKRTTATLAALVMGVVAVFSGTIRPHPGRG